MIPRQSGQYVEAARRHGIHAETLSYGVAVACPVCANGTEVIIEDFAGVPLGECNYCGATAASIALELAALDRQNGKPPESPAVGDEVFRLYTPAELLEFPKPRWLIEPFLREEGLNVLFGDTGVYKSFIAIDWGARAGVGALYISAEGAPGEFGERVAAWEQAAGRPSGILTLPEAVDLLDRRDVDKLLLTMLALDPAPALIVVDTLSRNMAGNESATEDMSAFVRACDRIRGETRCTMLVLHHTGWDNPERERGAKALRAAADVSVRAKRSGERRVRLQCAKVRGTAEWNDRIVALEQQAESLVVAQVSTPQEALDNAVREYLEEHPGASQNEVEKAVTGKNDDIRAAYKNIVRPVRPEAGRTPGQGAPRAAPKGARAQSHDPTLDPDKHRRLVEDGGWG